MQESIIKYFKKNVIFIVFLTLKMNLSVKDYFRILKLAVKFLYLSLSNIL